MKVMSMNHKQFLFKSNLGTRLFEFTYETVTRMEDVSLQRWSLFNASELTVMEEQR